MRGSIIEELYYGNIDPQDRGYRPKLPAKKASRLSERSGGKAHRAARRRKQVAVRFCNAYAEFMGESELDTFITGFRLGARFMMDTFLSDDTPLENY